MMDGVMTHLLNMKRKQNWFWENKRSHLRPGEHTFDVLIQPFDPELPIAGDARPELSVPFDLLFLLMDDAPSSSYRPACLYLNDRRWDRVLQAYLSQSVFSILLRSLGKMEKLIYVIDRIV
jgi:hypothetical protein